MKKKIWLIIILILFLWIGHTIFKSTIKNHHVTYELEKYKIVEDYQKKPQDIYTLYLTKGKEKYTIIFKKDLKKSSKILKSITTYKKENVNCIVTSYKKVEEKKMSCLLDNNQVSLDYLIKTENNNFKSIQTKAKKEHVFYPKSSTTKKQYKKIATYNNNIPNSQVYYIWNYKGIYILNSDETADVPFLDYDLYDNPLTAAIKNSFVLLENTSVNGIKKIYYYDYKKKKVKVAELEKIISKDSYINGVRNNLIYITDRKLKKQYTLDVLKGKQEEIDEEGTVYITYDEDERKELSKSDFFLKDQIFEEKEQDKIVKSKIIYSRKDNKYYQKTTNGNNVLLFELESVKEWQVKNDEIILLKDDTLYAYNEEFGLRKIVENKEFLYNYENIYQLGER